MTLKERLLGNREEQQKYLEEIGAVPGGFVKFRTGKKVWRVLKRYQISSASSTIFVQIQVAQSRGQIRTVFPWELVAAF